DTDVSDEMYWAAAELFITTGNHVYEDFVMGSPHHQAVPDHLGGDAGGAATAMNWQSTAALGTISLAVAPRLNKAAVQAERDKVVKVAGEFLDLVNAQGYRIPMKGGGAGFPWGSNSFVLNNLMIFALAYDFTRDARYLDGVVDGMDYILGRNPMAK